MEHLKPIDVSIYVIAETAEKTLIMNEVGVG